MTVNKATEPDQVENLSVSARKKKLPPLLLQNRSFLFFLGTQALGAFNDNVLKQLVLLLGVGYFISGIGYQAIVQFLFALPFLLFSGLAGDISDRYSKGRLMVLCKLAEIGIALLGVAAFLLINNGQTGFRELPLHLYLLAIVIFFLGTQSAFFGPPKYGGIPELVNSEDLAPATGLTQMTTFLAIIFGVSLAGLLADLLVDRMYLAGWIAVLIAILGVLSSLGIARNPPADPKRRISLQSFISVIIILTRIFRDDPLLMRIMIVYSWFWFIGGVVLTAINAFGRFQLGLNNFETSLMVATTSMGIAVGSALVGRLSRGKVRVGLIIPAMVMLVICLSGISLLPAHSPTTQEIELFNQLKNSPDLLQITNIFPPASLSIRILAFGMFFLLGISSGFYSVPLLSFIQARPQDSEKGRVFAAVNWFNWIFILASAIAYGIGMSLLDNHANFLLLLLGILSLLVGILLLPEIFRTLAQQKPEFVYFKSRQK